MVIAFYISLIFASVITAIILCLVLSKPIEYLLKNLVVEDIGKVSKNLLLIAIFISAVDGGLELSRYGSISDKDLTGNRWFVEIINSIIQTLSYPMGIVVVFVVLFIIAIGIIRAIQNNVNNKQIRKSILTKKSRK
jgi:hypothetical protein